MEEKNNFRIIKYSFENNRFVLNMQIFNLNSSSFRTVFNYEQGDIFGCVADIGWITGHTYVIYGPLLNGATTVLFESTPLHPDPGR